MSQWTRALPTCCLVALVMTSCVIRTGTQEVAPDVEQFASAGEALNRVSTVGLRTPAEMRRSREAYASILDEVIAIIDSGDSSALLEHQRGYLERTLAYFDQTLPLVEALDKAAAESQAGISAQVYEAQKQYLIDLVALDKDMDLPSRVATSGGVIPSEASFEESDLGDTIDLNEDEVLSLYEAGQYGDVVAMVAEAGAGKAILGPEARTAFALSLAEQGLLSEAIGEVDELTQGDMVSPDVMDLRLEAAVWRIAAGQSGSAEQDLRSFVEASGQANDQLAVGSRVAKAMLDEIGRGAKVPELVAARMAMEQDAFVEARTVLQQVLTSSVPADAHNRAEALLNELASVEDKSFERHLAQAREVGSNPARKNEALSLLGDVELAFPGERFQARIAAVRGEIEGSVSTQDVSYVERLDSANALLAGKKYEAAATEFEGLFGTPVSAEAQAGRERAVDLYVQEVREEMARDYLAAKRITDPAKRLTALASVYERLEQVSQTYPDSRMTSKLGSHMQVVKGEILKIDPGYFDAP